MSHGFSMGGTREVEKFLPDSSNVENERIEYHLLGFSIRWRNVSALRKAKNMKKLLTLSLFIIAILSCRSNENASETSPPKRPKAKQQKLNSTQIARIAAAQKLGELFTPARTVHLETVDDGLIGEIQSLYFVQEQNKFVILDTF